jgi:hypothetical protein
MRAIRIRIRKRSILHLERMNENYSAEGEGKRVGNAEKQNLPRRHGDTEKNMEKTKLHRGGAEARRRGEGRQPSPDERECKERGKSGSSQIRDKS